MRAAVAIALACAVVAAAAPAEAKKVSVTLYSESMWPECQQFEITTLYQTYTAKGMAAHIDLHQVPFGNAQIQGGSVQCQHGPDECKGNKYECCAIQLYPNASQWFPFNVCMENAGDNMLNEVQHCATKAGLDYQKIESCYSGEAGVQCIKNAAAKTNALNPPHRYTPWVTVNGEHLAGVQHLLSVVCSKIEGDKPAACSSATDDDDHMYNDDQQGTPLLRGVSE